MTTKKVLQYDKQGPLFHKLWKSDAIEAHRRGFSDAQWADMQPKGPPNYYIGDVVEFKAGGYGIINEVSQPHGGWPSEYSTTSVPNLPAYNKSAWHYELDFARLVGKSPLRTLSPIHTDGAVVRPEGT